MAVPCKGHHEKADECLVAQAAGQGQRAADFILSRRTVQQLAVQGPAAYNKVGPAFMLTPLIRWQRWVGGCSVFLC